MSKSEQYRLVGSHLAEFLESETDAAELEALAARLSQVYPPVLAH